MSSLKFFKVVVDIKKIKSINKTKHKFFKIMYDLSTSRIYRDQFKVHTEVQIRKRNLKLR